ncbi:GNAT family N-acetyltransferase [Microbulbifer sp. ALW1]|uniref:GNAT family N-acetyltransferase n=1 Tax=Microbulbifer sp. (strain ALW1) TaxID=1516059 RepID=UPI0013583B73|nr:GNAT family N-acetyltransferase [Microbulbifer sp. ALW1]
MIEQVSEENLKEVLPLIRAYQEFYEVSDICDEKNFEFFLQFCRNPSTGSQFVCWKDGRVVGFATVYFTFASSIISKVAILNDLYTVPESRGNGVGRKLIEHCRGFAEKHGAVRLQWVTAPENEAAQKLYDSMNTSKSSWYFYTYRS